MELLILSVLLLLTAVNLFLLLKKPSGTTDENDPQWTRFEQQLLALEKQLKDEFQRNR